MQCPFGVLPQKITFTKTLDEKHEFEVPPQFQLHCYLQFTLQPVSSRPCQSFLWDSYCRFPVFSVRISFFWETIFKGSKSLVHVVSVRISFFWEKSSVLRDFNFACINHHLSNACAAHSPHKKPQQRPRYMNKTPVQPAPLIYALSASHRHHATNKRALQGRY